MDYELLESPKVNDIRTRIRNDNNWGAGFYSMIEQLPALLSSTVSLVVSIIVLLPLFFNSNVFSDISSLLMLIAFFIVIIFNILFSDKKTKELHRILNETGSIYGYLGYFLWNKQDYKQGKDIRIFNGQNIIKTHLDDECKEKSYWTSEITLNNSAQGFVSGLSAGLLQVIAYIFVAVRAVSGALTIGSVLKFASIIYRFSSDLSSVFSSFTEYAIAAERQQSTMEYMNISDVIFKGTLPIEKRNDNEYEIEFKNVSFKYPGSEVYALKNLNMKLKIGHRMAIVGMNGSGKTSMIKLLCRLYDPTEGIITLNGIDIKKYNYTEYMSIFSVVFQDFKLFSFNLGQNVAASVEYDCEKAVSALKKSGFDDRLSTMTKGLETALYSDFEEDGVEISGGEAQKIALARALYKDAPFIILDEPTAALDPIAEFEIYSKFNEIVGDKTAIYISHRLSSCRFCDDIAVFDEGRLIERGSHDKLIANKEGKYYELWNAQAQYYV
ncbi:ABC transporter ATP-binding protein [Clostridium oryzae]|nr:ABC transporter ATP-binding protein [Clostridium oryzae]